MRILFLSLLSFLFAACTQLKVGVANIPTYFDGLKVHKDIPYGTRGQVLDVYESGDKHSPVLLFIHGGRWQDGTKDMYRFIGGRFAALGYVVVISNYQKYPNVRYPAFAEEGRDMVHWSISNASKYGGDPSQIFVMGHSSGAHTGAMIVANEVFGVKRNIDGFIGLSGPYDFVPEAKDVIDIFSNVSNSDMQATSFIDGTEPPMLLIHGAEDESVNISNLKKLEKSVNAKNGAIESIVYDGFNHVDPVSHMSWVYYDENGIVNDIDQFIRQHSDVKNR